MKRENTSKSSPVGQNIGFDTKNTPEHREILRLALGYLPYIDRVAITLRYWENCTIEEIAEFLGSTWDETDKRLIRATRLLRGALKHFAEKKSVSKLKTALNYETAMAA